MRPTGWKKESYRHALAARGVKTGNGYFGRRGRAPKIGGMPTIDTPGDIVKEKEAFSESVKNLPSSVEKTQVPSGQATFEQAKISGELTGKPFKMPEGAGQRPSPLKGAPGLTIAFDKREDKDIADFFSFSGGTDVDVVARQMHAKQLLREDPGFGQDVRNLVDEVKNLDTSDLSKTDAAAVRRDVADRVKAVLDRASPEGYRDDAQALIEKRARRSAAGAPEALGPTKKMRRDVEQKEVQATFKSQEEEEKIREIMRRARGGFEARKMYRVIRKLPGQNKYRVLSEGTGRNMGTYRTKEEAEARLRQVEFFKHRAMRFQKKVKQ